MVGTPDGNSVAERARPRSGRGAAERGHRLCRKPGARPSWGDEPRYKMQNHGGKRRATAGGTAAYNRSGREDSDPGRPRRSPRLWKNARRALPWSWGNSPAFGRLQDGRSAVDARLVAGRRDKLDPNEAIIG